MSKMTLRTEGDRFVVVTRRFAAPPKAVYRAHTEPKLLQKWLLGPDGWRMRVCICEAQPGGKLHYEGRMTRAAASLSRASSSSSFRSAESCTSNACIYPKQPPTITLRRGLMPTARVAF